MPDHLHYTPVPDSAILDGWLTSTNTLSNKILNSLPPGSDRVDMLDILNPPHWEFGHITWFHEFWVHRHGQVKVPSLLSNSDYLFNSSDIAHDDRWSIEIPALKVLMAYNKQVIDKSRELLTKQVDPQTAYFLQLSIFHQDMHNEAFAYMWQTLGFSEPFAPFSDPSAYQEFSSPFMEFSETKMVAGATSNEGFIFDNEKWAHSVTLPAFSISKNPVTNAQYLDFVESFANQKDLDAVEIPKHWKKEAGKWYQRYFNEWLDFQPNEPVRHISHTDAQRYCQWRQLRLPSEHELSLLRDQTPQQWQDSQLWEWTDSVFQPFPGFTADPYQDYSSPWFDGNYQVLKGGSMYTPDRLKRPSFRNFYAPHRSDHFCGFRTCLP